MSLLESSYKKNDFDNIFKTICKKTNPSSILEIGILDGYSLSSFLTHSSPDCKILAVDLFDQYEYKSANYDEIIKRFKKNKNLKIKHGDFFKHHTKAEAYDLIHIDISNDANIYEFALQNYFPLTNKLLVLEGGSKERDSVEWMLKYNKPKINNFLNKIENKYRYQIIKKFPSITIFYKDADTELIF
tara:strand:- start:352 stop:912 length:561 start_codon:yes stop_codon:yes gene_type:complete